MDDIDRKILNYLTEKDWASESAVINETFNGFGISKEQYIERLKVLQGKDLVRYERPYRNGAFVRITEEGRKKLKPFLNRTLNYFKSHILEILTLLITATSLVLGIWKILD
ncbi:TPA: hypothetical protein DCX66_03635 [Candidatus Nomurabacteria bacterium]|uniref:Uncharacterized protein n=1 Tax=Candidatus Nomurabacteria bacterium GW2011_GWE1_35_16 TaxID=1618761 RepID=A0A0G0EHY6_9BACT|nr:MAG: hypothetical protein UR55_C0001G0021 [Candidatus Nomurabacteria bacterium GW2011_GWF1_34_20]KKP63730.1 MAG: hypothetical protein UR57_C0001G0021 [Candidatus Nomurabacteria bacterium GW2011_GWE2_34_25]KKP66942.1 MAG: hypothetical protein UR64_C0001G0021 [Candidatus Nomurabacteria bacterium GW2011_GWE1_35_16]HAE36766.1 hypothetical protein [Candidatus Nomurabacteria bacterium]HAX65531.1 hypothetical protein [Candidatus Nomurabacteria bacterium]